MEYKFDNTCKIAVPTRNDMVDDHFGHCDHYTIFTIQNNTITQKEEYPSPQGCGCKSGIAPILRNIGVDVMLAGSMGEGAKNVLNANNIKVVRGCSGNVEELVKEYMAGEVSDSGEGCHAHGDGEHQCHG